MGCSYHTTSTYETVIDEAFDSLIIKQTEVSVILSAINSMMKENINLNETEFQNFFNKFLVPVGIEYQDAAKKIWLSYWMEFYKQKPYKRKIVFMKFSLALISQFSLNPKNINEIEMILNEYMRINAHLDVEDISERNFLFISIDEIFYIIKDYIYSISLLTIDYFKNFHSEPDAFKLKLNSVWNSHIINEFIKVTFFSKEDISNIKIPIRKFLEKFLPVLRDGRLIRKMLSDFGNKIT